MASIDFCQATGSNLHCGRLMEIGEVGKRNTEKLKQRNGNHETATHALVSERFATHLCSVPLHC